jgi:hypothetical protein
MFTFRDEKPGPKDQLFTKLQNRCATEIVK